MTEIIYPPAAKCFVMSADSICVVGDISAGVDFVELALVLKGETVVWSHANIVSVANNAGFPVMISYAGTGTPAEDEDYQVVMRPTTAGVAGAEIKQNITRQPETEIVEGVSAQNCLWCAFLPDPEQPGPYPKDTRMGDYIPTGPIQIPWNAGDVTMTADPDGNGDVWQHGPDAVEVSGPDGRVGTGRSLEVADYQHVRYGSDVIFDLSTELNKLVGMWRSPTGSGDPYPYKPFAIGASLSVPGVPDEAKQDGQLFLGMHDGFEWSNNSGDMKLEITWTPETCAKIYQRLKDAGVVQ